VSESDRFSILRLHLATLYHGGMAQQLLTRFGSAEGVFQASEAELRPEIGRRRRTLDRLLEVRTARRAERELRRIEGEGIACLVRGEEGYPPWLAETPDAPFVLFCRGELVPDDELAVGAVGSRRPSAYAIRQAEHFAHVLAPLGVTVVSGLARGVDIASQRAAIDSGGRTLGILGSGLGEIYPPEHRPFVERIARDDVGAVLTEFPFDAAPKSYHFPQRNRVLSGLSRAILVVEAGEKSGSLITVRWALDQGKSVYVIPGRVDQQETIGGLKLLRDGAAVALGPEDLLEDLNLRVEPSAAKPTHEPARTPLGGALGEQLTSLFDEEDAWYADAIAHRIQGPPHRTLGELSRLELEGALTRDAGGAYRRR
jgi:DNA processing protein